MAKVKKYITFDESDEKENFVLNQLSKRRGRFLTKYIVEAVIRYEGYLRVEEQKKLSRFLKDFNVPADEIGDMQEDVIDSPKQLEEPMNPIKEEVSTPQKIKIEEPSIEDSIKNTKEVNTVEDNDPDDMDISKTDISSMLAVSYTHLTLPTNSRV